MMPGFGEDHFINLLVTQYTLESELEKMKEELVFRCPDFNTVVGFRLFRPSYDRTKNLTDVNIKHAFSSLGVNLSDANAKLILKRYDSDRDGEVTFSDICDIFKPKDPALAKEFQRRLPFDHKKSEQDLQYETKAYLRTLFHKTLQVEQNIELLKLEL